MSRPGYILALINSTLGKPLDDGRPLQEMGVETGDQATTGARHVSWRCEDCCIKPPPGGDDLTPEGLRPVHCGN